MATTTCASAASRRALSTKQPSLSEQRSPRQASDSEHTLDQSCSSGKNERSARSPVAVVPAQPSIRAERVVLAGEYALLVEGLAQPGAAEVVAAALDEHGLRLLLEEPLHHGDILVDELLLQIDSRRRHDDPLLVPYGPGEGGHEIGEGFADAGSRLGREDARRR